jgi:capsular polysaccharide transport system permease protein
MPVAIPKRSPWTNQRLVLGALLHREAVTRFGEYKLGIMWMLVEPLISVIVLGLLLGPIIGRTAQDMPYPFFLLHGFVLLQTFSGPLGAGMKAIDANSGLLVFPKVQPLDLLLARFLFELVSSVLSFTAFCLLGEWFGIRLSLDNLHVLLACFLLTWLMGCGFGLMCCVGTAHYPAVEKIVAFVKRPLMFVSCVLYPYFSLPDEARLALSYNPLSHCIELSRSSLFPFYHTGDLNLWYPTLCSIVIFSFGICFFHNHRHFLTQR